MSRDLDLDLELDLALDIDPVVPGFFLRPDYYELLARLRVESPVREVAPGVKLVSRYDDIREISRDPERFRSGRGVLVDDPVRAGGATGSIAHMDPPQHGQWRRVLNRGCTGRALAHLEGTIRSHAVDLIEALPYDEEVDIVDLLAAPLPAKVIAELLGVPVGDRSKFRRWSDAMVAAIDDRASTADADQQSASELASFLLAHARAKGTDPGPDLVSLLVQSEIDGQKLTPRELMFFTMSLLVAGNETTRHLISGGMLVLAEHPVARAMLAADRSLIPSAIEECLRWVTPIQQFARTATRPTELSGTPVDEGDYLVMLYTSGNRDEAAFGPTASEFDPMRPVTVPNLAFGFGEHLCLGAALARMEARILFEELLERRLHYTVTGPGEWLPSSIVRGLHSLPIVFSHSKAFQ